MKKTKKILAVVLATLSISSMMAASVSCDVLNSFLSDSSSHEHSYEQSVVSPTCTEKGYTLHSCDSCEDSYKSDYVDAKGHTYVDRECSQCGELKPSEGLEYRLINDGKAYSVWGMGTCTDTEIVIPSTHEGKPVTEVGFRAFMGCMDITSVTILSGVNTIKYAAFIFCPNLTSITLPDSLISIENTFEECKHLTSITVDENNAKYKSVDGNLYTKDGKTLIKYANGKPDTTFTIPSGVTSIGNRAFSLCRRLTEVVIPHGVVSIGESAFDGCSGLNRIVIPASVNSIEGGAFNACLGVTSISVNENNANYQVIDGALYTKDGETLLQYTVSKVDKSFKILDGVVSITYGAFMGCSALENIVIPESVTDIGFAFMGCDNLTNVYYKGTAEEWAKISIYDMNSELLRATRYYYSETEPTVEGNYWHYDKNGEVVVW